MQQVRSTLLAAGMFFGLLALALLLFSLADWLETPGDGTSGPSEWLVRLDGPAAIDRVASAAEVVAGVLAVAITVVAIVVELAANRYTHRITELFIREPLNGIVIGFFVLTTVLCVWISTTPGTENAAAVAFPHAGLVICMTMVTICLLALIPYFQFVFNFLSPVNVIARIRRQAERAVEAACRRMRPGIRAAVIAAIEELEDVAHGARAHSDRSLSMAAVDALGELLEEYQPLKSRLPDAWFQLDGALVRDPDFVSMDPTVLRSLVDERIWFETKIMRNYYTIYGASLIEARDVANLIALNTCRIGSHAAREQPAVLALAVRFFNSYLRAAINVGDIRTAFYVLQQYRILCQETLEAGRGDVALEIAGHFDFYGREAREMGVDFLLEVVAFDLAQVVEFAVERGDAEAGPLLDLFLDVGGGNDESEPEERLLPVRRIQVQLATFFLERGDEPSARRIFAAMERERPERLAAIRSELSGDVKARYWEFNDRGVNFRYVSPERRAKLPEFFSWFGATPAH